MNLKFKGKIIGFLAGFIFSGDIIGGILVCIISHFLFDNNDYVKKELSDEEIINCEIVANNTNILTNILELSIGIIRLKNNILLTELDVIKDFFKKYFKFDKEEIKNIDGIIKHLISNGKNIDLKNSMLNINKYCCYEDKIQIIHLLFVIASSDMNICSNELDYIFDVSQKINITSNDYNILKKHFIKEDLDYYKILGLSEDATIAEIKKAYRKAVSELHPDKKRDSSYDNERFQQIVYAYNELMKIKKNEK